MFARLYRVLCAQNSLMVGPQIAELEKQKSTFCVSQGKGEGQKENDRKTKEREKVGLLMVVVDTPGKGTGRITIILLQQDVFQRVGKGGETAA
jgi:hypothetical protein